MLKESHKNNTVITDASCFILLDKINALHLLEILYAQVFTTPEIAAEYGNPLPQWVEVREVTNKDLFIEYSKIVDKGEASAIDLAFEVPLPMLIIDDLEGRKSWRANFNSNIPVR